MTSALHWQIREIMPHLTDSELRLLLALNSRTNVRNRCWPSSNQLQKDTGMSRPALVNARKKLIAMKAIDVVAHALRVEEETTLPPRQFVYQMTGKIIIGETTYEYLYTNESLSKGSSSLPLKVNSVNGYLNEPKVSTGTTEVKDEEDARESLLVRAVRLYELAFGSTVSPLIADMLKDYAELYTIEWLEDALKEAAVNNATSLNYVKAVLQNWRKEGRGSKNITPFKAHEDISRVTVPKHLSKSPPVYVAPPEDPNRIIPSKEEIHADIARMREEIRLRELMGNTNEHSR